MALYGNFVCLLIFRREYDRVAFSPALNNDSLALKYRGTKSCAHLLDALRVIFRVIFLDNSDSESVNTMTMKDWHL